MKKILNNKLDYLWFSLAIIISLILSYGIFVNWYLVIGGLVILAVLLLILNNDEIGLFIILLSMLFGQLFRFRITDYGGSILAIDLIILIVMAVWVLRKLIKKEKLIYTPINWLIVLFIALAGISNLHSLSIVLSSEVLRGSLYLLRWLAYAGIFFMILDYAKDESRQKKYWLWLLSLGIGVAILGFIQLIYLPDFSFMENLGWDPHQGRLLSTFFDPNLVGGFLAFIISLILGILFMKEKSLNTGREISFLTADRNYLVIAGLILFLALILTFSRSAYLGFFISFIVLALIRSWKIAILGIVIIGLTFLAFPRSVERIKAGFNLDVTAQARIESWKTGIKIISDYALLGVGFNNLPYIQPAYSTLEESKIAHGVSGFDSSLLTLWATAGIFGLLSYLAIYLTIIWYSFKNYLDKNKSKLIRGFGLGLGAALIGLLVHSQFVNSLLFPPMMALIWFSAGILFAGEKYQYSLKKLFVKEN